MSSQKETSSTKPKEASTPQRKPKEFCEAAAVKAIAIAEAFSKQAKDSAAAATGSKANLSDVSTGAKKGTSQGPIEVWQMSDELDDIEMVLMQAVVKPAEFETKQNSKEKGNVEQPEDNWAQALNQMVKKFEKL